jgi:hypothetical protein
MHVQVLCEIVLKNAKGRVLRKSIRYTNNRPSLQTIWGETMAGHTRAHRQSGKLTLLHPWTGRKHDPDIPWLIGREFKSHLVVMFLISISAIFTSHLTNFPPEILEKTLCGSSLPASISSNCFRTRRCARQVSTTSPLLASLVRVFMTTFCATTWVEGCTTNGWNSHQRRIHMFLFELFFQPS